jgi:hypothetical protein
LGEEAQRGRSQWRRTEREKHRFCIRQVVKARPLRARFRGLGVLRQGPFPEEEVLRGGWVRDLSRKHRFPPAKVAVVTRSKPQHSRS